MCKNQDCFNRVLRTKGGGTQGNQHFPLSQPLPNDKKILHTYSQCYMPFYNSHVIFRNAMESSDSIGSCAPSQQGHILSQAVQRALYTICCITTAKRHLLKSFESREALPNHSIAIDHGNGDENECSSWLSLRSLSSECMSTIQKATIGIHKGFASTRHPDMVTLPATLSSWLARSASKQRAQPRPRDRFCLNDR